MRFTQTYHLASLEEGERLSPLEDSRRFLTIDRQLLGLFQVLGNGVLGGWNVSSHGDLSVVISPGAGNVAFMAAETLDPRNVLALPPNKTVYVYAQAIEQTRFNRDVNFFADTTLFDNNQAVLLAKVITGPTAVLSIDSTVRNDISFIEEIRTLINQHRHRGGSDNPSKIDLAAEVIGQLPGFRVDGLDAAKLVSGRLAPARIPLLEHGDLLHSGILTHAQLDSFVRNLTNPNVRLLGEIAATDMLQLWIAQKHMWHDIDANTTNMLIMIPGISPDSQTDFQATTAIVDKFNHTISGIPSLGGRLTTTTFNTILDFDSVFLNVNCTVGKDPNGAFFDLKKPLTQTIVENFDDVFNSGSQFPGWTLGTVPSNNQSTFTSDAVTKNDGAFSAKMHLDQSFTVQATKLFSATQDWSQYNELHVAVETLSADHGQIWFQILGGTAAAPIEIQRFRLLQSNEVTSGFETIVKDLTSISDRTKVVGIRIFTDTSLGWDLSPFTLNVDSIILNNNLFYLPSGVMRFRLETPQTSQWAGISWVGDLNGGQIQARARSSPNFAVFDQSTAVPFSSYSSLSGANPNVPNNTNIEVEIAITADPTRTATPVVRSVTVSYITNSADHGITIDTATAFLRGTKLSNVRVESPSDVVIDGRIDVGDIVYGSSRTLQQVDKFGTPIFGVTGSGLFLSPFQAVQQNFVLRQPSLNGVTTAIKELDRTYLVSDTMNDRVLLFDRNGGLVRGLASNNIHNITKLYPITAVYNPTNTTLYVCWSTSLSLSGVDLSKFTLAGAGVSMTLSNIFDKVSKTQGTNTSLQTSNVTPIVLGAGHALELKNFLDDTGISDNKLFLEVEAAAAKEGVDVTNVNFATLVGPRGMSVFVGDVKFVQGIFRPVSVVVTSDGGWLVSNAKPLVLGSNNTDPLTGTGVADITSTVKFDPGTGLSTFSDNSVDYSVATLGAAIEYSSRYLAVAGIVKSTSSTSGSTTTTATTTATTAATTASGASGSSGSSGTGSAEQDALKGYKGSIKIIERSSGAVVFDRPTSDGTYGSDVQVDPDGNLIIIERSFDGSFGRGRVARLDGDGNVFFQYGLTDLAAPNDVRLLSTGNLIVSS